MTPRVMSTMFAALMRELGYDRFGAAGCDWGAYVTALLGLDHPDALVGIHMGMLNVRAPDYERTPEDAAFGARAKPGPWCRENTATSRRRAWLVLVQSGAVRADRSFPAMRCWPGS